MTGTPSPSRDPELVSGSISGLETCPAIARWMLKQVQHDEEGLEEAISLEGSVG